jgi:hypothetical protein
MEYKPKLVICLAKGDSFKYTCKNIHLDSSNHEVNNTYRFNRNVSYLVKNQEDYDELINHDMFEAYSEEEEVKEVKETKKEKKAREKKEKESVIDIQSDKVIDPEVEVETAEEILEENKDNVPEVE